MPSRPAMTRSVVGLFGLAIGLVSGTCTNSLARNYNIQNRSAAEGICFFEYCNLAGATNLQTTGTQRRTPRDGRMGMPCHPVESTPPMAACSKRSLTPGNLVQTARSPPDAPDAHAKWAA